MSSFAAIYGAFRPPVDIDAVTGEQILGAGILRIIEEPACVLPKYVTMPQP
jgi:hypothetical protein